MVTDEKVNEAFEELKKCMWLLHQCSEAHKESKEMLERGVAEGLASGTILGKNAQMRDAAARELFAEEYKRAWDDEGIVGEAKLHLSLAQLEVKRIDFLLRAANDNQR